MGSVFVFLIPNNDLSAARGLFRQASDIDIHAKEILKARDKLNKILAKHTGKTLKSIEKDTDRDRFMSADEAKEYGIIDQVLNERK